MPGRSLVIFRGLDGTVLFETLASSDEFADLVDPDDGSIRHAEPFFMHGGEWRVHEVTVTDDATYIECVSSTPEGADQIPTVSPLVSEPRTTPRRQGQ